MSRWYLASNEAMDLLASESCKRAGLQISGSAFEENPKKGRYFLRCYRKRTNAVDNLRHEPDGDWACSAGTVILGGKVGDPALAGCYRLFSTEKNGPGMIQSEAIGHFAQAIKRGSEIRIFTDGLGAMRLYYCQTPNGWFVSNSMSLCAEAASSRSLDPTRFLVQVLQTNLPGEKTFYSDTNRLFGSQQLRIDLRNGRFQVEQLPDQESHSWDVPSIDEALEMYMQEVRTVFRQIAAVGPVGLFGTGGLDSRTVLSALLDQRANVRLMYGTGNSRLTDFHQRDLAIAGEIAGACNLQFERLDWSGTAPHSEQMLEDLFSHYGFQSEIYGGSQGFLNSFRGAIFPYPAIMVGGYSPVFTNGKPWEKPEGKYPFSFLVDDTMHFQGGDVMTSRCIRDKESYREAVAEGVREALAINGIDYPEAGADLKTFVKAKLLLYVRAEARFLNLINEFGMYIAPFMVKRLYRPLIEIPFRFRQGDEFQLRLIQMLKPELIQLPLYSGIFQARIDPITMRFVRDLAPAKPLWKRVLHKAASPAVRQVVRSTVGTVGKEQPAPDQDTRIRLEYGSRVMRDPMGQRWFSATDDFSPKDLARIYQYLKGANSLGYEISA
jgi:hypothetical protein